jgi:integrase
MAEGQPNTGRIFRNIQDPRNAFFRAIRVHGFTAHGLRRLASTRLIGAGVDPAAYEALMGHSFSMGLKVYAEAEPARLAAAADLLAGG